MVKSQRKRFKRFHLSENQKINVKLKKAAIIAYDQLVKNLKTHGYYQVIGTNAIYPHKI